MPLSESVYLTKELLDGAVGKLNEERSGFLRRFFRYKVIQTRQKNFFLIKHGFKTIAGIKMAEKPNPNFPDGLSTIEFLSLKQEHAIRRVMGLAYER